MAETVIASIAAVGLEILVGAAKETATDLLSNAMTSMVSGLADFIDTVEWLPDVIGDTVVTFAGNLADQVDDLGFEVANSAATWTTNILGVTGAQTKLIKDINDSVSDSFDELASTLNLSVTKDLETGAALTDLYFRMAQDRGNSMIGMAEQWYQMVYGTTEVFQTQQADYAQSMLDDIKRHFAADLQAVENLSDKEAIAYADAIMATAGENIKMYQEWFSEMVAIPIAYGTQIQWAMSNVDVPTDEEIKEYLKKIIVIQHELGIEMAEKNIIVPEVGR
jgi:hypothetical protein